MWLDTPSGKAFMPADLTIESLQDFEDSQFPECFNAIEKLQDLLHTNSDLDIISQFTLQREARAFSPRLAGEKVGYLAYPAFPFIAFHVFDSEESLKIAQASDFAYASDPVNPCDVEFVKQVHALILDGRAIAGNLRVVSSWIGERHSAIDNAQVILTPPDRIDALLSQLSEFLKISQTTCSLAASAMIHFQLVSIHPFNNANGRLARILVPPVLRHYGIIDRPGLYVSEGLLRRRVDYFRRLACVQREGDVIGWIRFFADVLAEQATHTHNLIRLLLYVRADLIQRINNAVILPNVDLLVDEILLSPTIAESRVAHITRASKDEVRERLPALFGLYGFSQVTSSLGDPLFQFADVHELFFL